MHFNKIRAACILVVCALCLTAVVKAQQNLANVRDSAAVTNRDIVLMTKSKFDDATIVKTIQAFRTDLDVSVPALMELKEAGVTQPVIQAMLAKATDGSKSVERVGSVATPTVKKSASPSEEPATNLYSTPTNPYPRPIPSGEQTTQTKAGQLSRVYLEAVSSGTNRNAARDQSMEMAKDFLKVCPNVKITINQAAADYTIRLNHIEHGWIYRDNQIEVFDHNGDLMHNKEGGSIKRNVQEACDLIYSDWAHQGTN